MAWVPAVSRNLSNINLWLIRLESISSDVKMTVQNKKKSLKGEHESLLPFVVCPALAWKDISSCASTERMHLQLTNYLTMNSINMSQRRAGFVLMPLQNHTRIAVCLHSITFSIALHWFKCESVNSVFTILFPDSGLRCLMFSSIAAIFLPLIDSQSENEKTFLDEILSLLVLTTNGNIHITHFPSLKELWVIFTVDSIL